MKQPLLQVVDVNAGYGHTTVLTSLSIDVHPADRLAVIGRNGVGKSTALRVIMGLVPVRRGKIIFRGDDISGLAPHHRAACGIGYVPQTRDIFPSLTVEENLIAGLKRRPRSALDEAYALFPRLLERRRNWGMQLSGGEQQMLSVARALLGRPSLILLDEPLEGLAPVTRLELLAAFRKMGDKVAVVIVEQQVEEALSYAERSVIMDRGAIVHEASAVDLLNDGASLDRWVGMAVH